MATLKDVKNKIAGVKKTKQITRAMNMVATSRLRGAQRSTEAFRPYAGKFAEVLGSLAEKAGEDASPLLIPREEVQKGPRGSLYFRPRIMRWLQYQPDQ